MEIQIMLAKEAAITDSYQLSCLRGRLMSMHKMYNDQGALNYAEEYRNKQAQENQS